MDGTAVKEIERIVDEGMNISIDGKVFSRKEFRPVLFCPRPDPVCGFSISGLLDFIKENRDEINFSKCFIHVKSFDLVELVGPISKEDEGRTVFFRASMDKDLPKFPFDSFIDQEAFIIMCRALFAYTVDLDIVVQCASKVVAQDEITSRDNGLAQGVTVRKGVSGGLSEEIVTRGVYALKPYRTFREIEQPETEFILRLRENNGGIPKIALFDSAGGSWKYHAMVSIKEYIEKNIVSEVTLPVIC